MTTLPLQTAARPLMPVLAALSVAHLLNDLIQSMIPAVYPLIKETYELDFVQIGLITLAFQVTSSLHPRSRVQGKVPNVARGGDHDPTTSSVRRDSGQKVPGERAQHHASRS